MAEIQYETPDGIEHIARDGWHTDTPGVVTGFDHQSRDNPRTVVAIPIERVVKIEGKSTTTHPQ